MHPFVGACGSGPTNTIDFVQVGVVDGTGTKQSIGQFTFQSHHVVLNLQSFVTRPAIPKLQGPFVFWTLGYFSGLTLHVVNEASCHDFFVWIFRGGLGFFNSFFGPAVLFATEGIATFAVAAVVGAATPAFFVGGHDVLICGFQVCGKNRLAKKLEK